VAPAELLLWTSTTVVRTPLVEKQHRQLGLLFVVLGEREVQGGRERRSRAKGAALCSVPAADAPTLRCLESGCYRLNPRRRPPERPVHTEDS
jgi:hypothetical protein